MERHALGTVVPHDALASLVEKSHGSLSGVTPNQHHARAHSLGGNALDHTDVEVSTPLNNQVLTYETATSKWKNKDPIGAGVDEKVKVSSTDTTTRYLQEKLIGEGVRLEKVNAGGDEDLKIIGMRYYYVGSSTQYGPLYNMTWVDDPDIHIVIPAPNFPCRIVAFFNGEGWAQTYNEMGIGIGVRFVVDGVMVDPSIRRIGKAATTSSYTYQCYATQMAVDDDGADAIDIKIQLYGYYAVFFKRNMVIQLFPQ